MTTDEPGTEEGDQDTTLSIDGKDSQPGLLVDLDPDCLVGAHNNVNIKEEFATVKHVAARARFSKEDIEYEYEVMLDYPSDQSVKPVLLGLNVVLEDAIHEMR